MKKSAYKILASIMVLTLSVGLYACSEQEDVISSENTQMTSLATETFSEAVPEETTEPPVLMKDLVYFNIDKLHNKDLVRVKDRTTGMYQIRFFNDGEYITYETDNDNAIKSMDRFFVCIPEFDYRDMFSGVKSAQSQYGGVTYDSLIVTGINGSSVSVSGSLGELVLSEDAFVYDMTGISCEIGTLAQVREGDKLCAYVDDEGLAQVIYIIERPQVHDDQHSCNHCQGTPAWSVWDGTEVLTSGHYVMSQNVELEDTITISGEDVVLCLNGFSLTCTNRVFILENGAKLAVTDHAGFTEVYKGYIAGGGIPTAGVEEAEWLGGTVYAKAGTELVLYGGELRSNVKEGTGRAIYRGATVYTEGTFQFHDGVLTGGHATQRGGGLYVGPEGSFQMDGGIMRYGTSENSGGTAAFDKECAEVNISGGMLVAGIAVKFGGGIYTEKSMKVTGGEFTSDLSDGINAEYGGVFCISNGADVEFKGNVVFHHGSATEGGNLACRLKCHALLGDGVVLRDGFAENSGGNVVNFGIMDIRGAKILDGYAPTGGGNLYSYSNGNTIVNLYSGEILRGVGTNGGNIRLSGNPGNYENGAVMNIYGGLIADGEATTGDGGNIIVQGHSEVHMTGGEITGGKASRNGGGICNAYSTENQVASLISLGGSARIVDNEGTDVFISSQTVIEFENDNPFTDDARIGLAAINPTVALAVGMPQDAEKAFFWNEGGMTVVNVNGELFAQ